MSKQQQYYQVGGTLKPDDPSYIERQADINLYEGLIAGKFCYIFNSRQMGKSSLQVRVSKQLANEGFRCVLISLESFGTRGVTQQRWYYTFIQDLADKFELPTELLETWLHESRSLAHVKRFSDFFEKILLPEVYQNIVIFIDEIDTVLSLDFPTDDFFAFIRYCYNQRAINPNFKRITFSLLGVATPSQLIKDNQRTPFNIGEAIQLKSFSYNEARTLAQGLESKVSDYKIAEAIIQEVLNWTDGQPFLTQKICEIIVDDEQIIPLDKRLIRKWVEELVISRIINNWEEQDNPQHLRTIRDRIINSKEPTLKLLKLYQKIRQQQELPVDDSPEQSELLLSGLVLENNRKLKISNRIYEFVFDSQWVAELLADKRPYEEELLGWLSSDKKKSWLLQKEKLQTAMEWCAGKNLTLEDYQFINASQELEISFINANQKSQIANLETKIQKSKIFQRFLTGITASMMIITGVVGFQLKEKILSLVGIPYVLEPELFSQGERTFFLGDGNIYLKRGLEAFKRNDYSQAKKLFEKAKKIDIKDPEAEIYYNNALAYEKGNPLTLAVVVPVNARKVIAQEILRGVALAQTNLNNKDGLNGRLLNILIADDENNPNQAQTVAQELSKDSNILGVIGHYTSPASDKAIPEYEKVGLAMISPGSTSTKLIEKKSKVFFRTTPSDKFTAQQLVDYAIKKNIRQVVICYTSQDIFSVSLKEEFEDSFKRTGRKIIEIIDLADPFQDSSQKFFYTVSQNKPDAVALFPNTEQVPIAINIAQEIQTSQNNYPIKLQLLGGNTLYIADTLQKGKNPFGGKNAFEGLTLTAPWFAEEAIAKKFAKQATSRWQNATSDDAIQVGWQNATSYDATQAFINALSASKKPSRKTVLENIPLVQLSPDETSGGGLKFNKNGERERKPVLVQVVKGKFERVDEN